MRTFHVCESRFPRSVFSLNMKLCVSLIACLGALALPAGALAIRCAPPGNSGVSQYYETIPGPSCNTGPDGHGHHHGGGGGISKHTADELGKQGPTGQAVAQLVVNTGTVGTAANGAGLGTGASTPNVDGRGLISALLHPILTGASGAGGAGPLLPIFLVGALVLVVGWLLLRRHRRPSA
jgi:hypothetical protein